MKRMLHSTEKVSKGVMMAQNVIPFAYIVIDFALQFYYSE
jgi:hypothetical protein